MQTNKEIVHTIQEDKSYYQVLENIMKNHQRKDELIGDLYHELILIFLEYDNEKLNKVVDNGALKFYWVRIAMSQWQSSTSEFYYKYRKSFNELEYESDLEQIEEVVDNERLVGEIDKDNPFYEETYEELVKRVTDRTLQDIKENWDRGWYLVRLFNEYVEIASYRKLSDETMIPESSVGVDLRIIRKELSKRINEELERLDR